MQEARKWKERVTQAGEAFHGRRPDVELDATGKPKSPRSLTPTVKKWQVAIGTVRGQVKQAKREELELNRATRSNVSNVSDGDAASIRRRQELTEEALRQQAANLARIEATMEEQHADLLGHLQAIQESLRAGSGH